MRSIKKFFRIITLSLLIVCILSACNANGGNVNDGEGSDTTAYNEEKADFFPPPAEILINCKYGHIRLHQGMEMYNYVYSRINGRVPESGMVNMEDEERDPYNIYRGNNETYVTFSYTAPGVDSENCFLQLDKNKPDEITEINYLFFPLSGKATNGVLTSKKIVDEVTGEQDFEIYCHGPLTTDQELIDTIWEYIGQEVGTTTKS